MPDTFIKVFDNLLDHHSWMDADPEHVGTWVLVLGYCRRNKTDGHFPSKLTARYGASAEAVSWLLSAGRFHAPGHDCRDCPQPDDGRLYLHAYLDHQSSREEQEALSKKRSAAGRKGARARSDKQGAEQVANQHAEQRSQAEVEGEVEVEGDKASAKPTPPTRPEITDLCNLLADQIETNGSKRPTVSKKWLDACRLMLDRDKRTVDEIRGAILWSQQHSFWRSNILSMPKLREKYDQLRLQAERERGGRRPSGRAERIDAIFEDAIERGRA